MERYVAGSDLILTLPFVDSQGQALTTPASYTFELIDSSGAQVHAGTGSTAPDDTGATVTLLSTHTALEPGVVRDVMLLRIAYTSDGSTRQNVLRFIVELADPLIVGLNSFQNFSTALTNAAGIERIEAFESATYEQQIAALESAHRAICSLRFYVEDSHIPDILRITQERWDGLPTRFKQALRQAQIVEANESLDPNSTWRRRQDGYFSETVGESSIAFRPGRLLMTPVSRRSLTLLSRWLNWSVELRRE